MKRVEYVCNICEDVVRKERMGPDIRPFVGLEFGLMGNHCKARDRFITKQPYEVERHICHFCLAGLVSLARRTLSPGTLKDAMGVD